MIRNTISAAFDQQNARTDFRFSIENWLKNSNRFRVFRLWIEFSATEKTQKTVAFDFFVNFGSDIGSGFQRLWAWIVVKKIKKVNFLNLGTPSEVPKIHLDLFSKSIQSALFQDDNVTWFVPFRIIRVIYSYGENVRPGFKSKSDQ